MAIEKISSVNTKPITSTPDKTLEKPVNKADEKLSTSAKYMLGATALAGVIALGVIGHKNNWWRKAVNTVADRGHTTNKPTATEIPNVVSHTNSDTNTRILECTEIDGIPRLKFRINETQTGVLKSVTNNGWEFTINRHPDGNITSLYINLPTDTRYGLYKYSTSPETIIEEIELTNGNIIQKITNCNTKEVQYNSNGSIFRWEEQPSEELFNKHKELIFTRFDQQVGERTFRPRYDVTHDIVDCGKKRDISTISLYQKFDENGIIMERGARDLYDPNLFHINFYDDNGVKVPSLRKIVPIEDIDFSELISDQKLFGLM